MIPCLDCCRITVIKQGMGKVARQFVHFSILGATCRNDQLFHGWKGLCSFQSLQRGVLEGAPHVISAKVKALRPTRYALTATCKNLLPQRGLEQSVIQFHPPVIIQSECRKFITRIGKKEMRIVTKYLCFYAERR